MITTNRMFASNNGVVSMNLLRTEEFLLAPASECKDDRSQAKVSYKTL